MCIYTDTVLVLLHIHVCTCTYSTSDIGMGANISVANVINKCPPLRPSDTLTVPFMSLLQERLAENTREGSGGWRNTIRKKS